MAVNNNSGRFFLRFLGLTGIFVAVAGAVLWSAFDGDVSRYGLFAVCAGIGLLVLTILFETGDVMRSLRSQRGAVGSSVFVQVLLAIVLIAGVNVFSFYNYQRFDWTWDRAFTLPASVRAQLSQLRGDTDIVVLQEYVSFGQRGENKQDRYDLAAQKKIIEKVRDLAELFQDLGPRFRVRVLDIQDDDFDLKLQELRKAEEAAARKRGEDPRTPLADAIEKAPENSIFFHADGKVQRLAFHDVYTLDREASEKANGGRGNLVLNFQGVEPFARKIFNIEEKKPRVTLAVVHPALSMTSRDHPLLTMNGAKKALESQGFVCTDLLLRKQDPEGGLSQEPAAQTYDENRYEQIEEELLILDLEMQENEKSFAKVKTLLDAWKNQSLAELGKTYVYVLLPNGQQGVISRTSLKDLETRKIQHKTIPVDEEDRAGKIALYGRDYALLERELEAARKERDTLIREKSSLNVEDLAEKKRIADVEAKMRRTLADTDLLIIPRFTFHHLPTEQIIANRVHKLDDLQLKGIKSYLKEGKPVLFLLGPSNDKREMPAEFGGGDNDGLEPMLASLGIALPKQTVLYNAETKEFNERKIGLGFSSRELELPPVLLDWPAGAGQVVKRRAEGGENSVRTSMHVTSRAVGKNVMKDLQIRHPRPVYVMKDGDNRSIFDEEAVVLMAGEDTWNENSPFLNEKREVPRYRPTKDDDPKKGTIEEVRRGPFPVAVAIEKRLPAEWYEGGKPAKARLAVIGNGGVFVGQTLSPIKEKLLLDVSNWLVGRDDLLAREHETWNFPRVGLSEDQAKLWHWGMFLGLPLLFAYLGMLMWFVRRMR